MDIGELKQKKTKQELAIEKFDIIKFADECIVKPALTVTTKRKTFAPDKHYYCSVGPYWWPDPNNSGKYVNKDGLVNPDSKLYDSGNLFSMITRCQYYSQAYYFTRKKKYYKAFHEQIRVWFINTETYMKPSFKYAQVIPGENNNEGRSTGMIDAYSFNTLIESVRLMNSLKRIDKKTYKALQNWFLIFADDSEERFGSVFRKANNNISLAYDVTMAKMYLFAGDEYKTKQIVDAFAELRIKKQIKEDGSQPSELQRTRAFFYSMYNLTHIIDMCYLARYWYPNYYEEHRERIDKAFEFLAPYIEAPETFPYQQITSWEACKKDYYKQLERVKVLRGDGNN